MQIVNKSPSCMTGKMVFKEPRLSFHLFTGNIAHNDRDSNG